MKIEGIKKDLKKFIKHIESVVIDAEEDKRYQYAIDILTCFEELENKNKTLETINKNLERELIARTEKLAANASNSK